MGRRRGFWPARRRRRASSGDAVVVILVVAALAVAAIGVYLLIAGAVALLGWLATVTLKAGRNHQTPRLAEATSATTAAPPTQQFQALVPVDPMVFADRAALEAAASVTFAAWVRRLPSAPADPTDTVRSLHLHRHLIGRLTTRLDGRRFGWKSAPYRGRDRMLGTAIALDGLDPHHPPNDLRIRSSHLTLCKSCGGDGRLTCESCAGAARVTCNACHGEGKVMGVTANGAHRKLNCKTCKGKASFICHACNKGQIDCSSCAQSGRLENWLEVEGGARDGDVQVEPDGDVTRAFTWGKDGVQASHDEISRDARVVSAVSRDRLLTLEDLPRDVPAEWRDAHWHGIQARLQPGERVIGQSFTLLEVPSIEVAYAVGNEVQSVGFEGLRMLAPPASYDHLFASRARSLRCLAYVVGAVPAVVVAVYLARGSYFINPATAAVAFCTALAAVAIYSVVWHASLRRRARDWVAGAVILVAATTTLAIFAEPSARAARRYIDAGRLGEARAELEALGDERDPKLAPLWADVHLRDALASNRCSTTTDHLTKIPPGAPQRATAQAHADALAVAAAETALTSADFDSASTAIGCASETTRSGSTGRSIEARVSLGLGRGCVASKDWSCALARAKTAGELGAITEATGLAADTGSAIRLEVDAHVAAARGEHDTSRRLENERAAVDLWTTYLVHSDAAPAQLTMLKAQVSRDAQLLAQEEQARQAVRDVEAKRQREAAAREEKRRAAQEELQRQRDEAALRRSEPSGLLCCDGSLSPSCSCGGSHRGCCSHHGGICGCQ